MNAKQSIRLNRLISLDGSTPVRAINTPNNIFFKSSMFRGSVALDFLGVLHGIQLGKLNKMLLSIAPKNNQGIHGVRFFKSSKAKSLHVAKHTMFIVSPSHPQHEM